MQKKNKNGPDFYKSKGLHWWRNRASGRITGGSTEGYKRLEKAYLNYIREAERNYCVYAPMVEKLLKELKKK